MKKVYIAATGQDKGKTTISLGLYNAVKERGLNPSFIKPVGQKLKLEDMYHADKDVVLMRRIYTVDDKVQDMSPVTIPQGFTTEYVFHRNKQGLEERVSEAIAHIEAHHDFLLIEGTGHAGVGSVIDMSNADVARLIGVKVIIIAEGGIGSAIDEICLNRAMFERKGVEILGAIVNKVLPEKLEKIGPIVRQGLKNHGIECLGLIPHYRVLSEPTIKVLAEELNFEVLSGDDLTTRIGKVIVAAMMPQNAISHMCKSCLAIIPGDRVDNMLLALSAHMILKTETEPRIGALLLTGGIMPPDSIFDLLKQSGVPVLRTDKLSADCAYEIKSFTPKITPEDKDKIALTRDMIKEYVNIDYILEHI